MTTSRIADQLDAKAIETRDNTPDDVRRRGRFAWKRAVEAGRLLMLAFDQGAFSDDGELQRRIDYARSRPRAPAEGDKETEEEKKARERAIVEAIANDVFLLVVQHRWPSWEEEVFSFGVRCKEAGICEVYARCMQHLADDLRSHGRAPLSENAAAAYEILSRLPLHRALKGSELVDAMHGHAVYIDESTLRSRIIPELKRWGVENTPRVGYFIPEAARQNATDT